MLTRSPWALLAIGSALLWAQVAHAAPLRVFTAEQARAGKAAYASSCGLCHRAALQGRTGAPGELPDVNTLPANMLQTIDQAGGQIPPLAGSRFMAKWGTQSTRDFAKRVANAVSGFPPTDRNDSTYLLLTAYFLLMNGARPGHVALTADTDVALNAATGRAAR